jgi:hypothetical protein
VGGKCTVLGYVRAVGVRLLRLLVVVSAVVPAAALVAIAISVPRASTAVSVIAVRSFLALIAAVLVRPVLIGSVFAVLRREVVVG